MPVDIYEETKLTPSAILEHGVKAGEKVEFAFCQDGKEIKRMTVDIKEDADAGATVEGEEYTAPKVDDDKESYALDFHFYHGENARMNCAQYTVWPKTATLTAVWKKDDSKFDGFRFRVLQGGISADPEGQKTLQADGAVTFPLDKGKGFIIEAISPYLIEQWETDKGRKRKLKGDVKVEAEFVSPKLTTIKQYVNFDVEEFGRKGVGNEVTIQVGVKGDRDKNPGDRVGKAKIFVYVKVTFGPKGDKKWNSKSERSDPKTELKAGLNLSDLVEKTAGKEYTGKVEIAGPDNVGEFKVCLGNAGGDTCKVEIGGTDVCQDANITFENWRKLYYEIMAPDFMDLENGNFPATTLTEIKNVGATVFIEYIHEKSHIFTEAECPAGTVYTGKFVGRDAGPFNRDKVYILTDHSFTLYPKAFEGAKSPRLIKIKLCDVNYFFDNGDALTTLAGPIQTKKINIPVSGYFMPSSSLDGSSSIKTFTWEADIDPDALDATTKIVFNAAVRLPAKPAKVRYITVKELNQTKEHKIEYKKPLIGHIPTEIPDAEKTKLETFLGTLFDDKAKLRALNEIKIEIHAEDSESDRQEDRFKGVEDFVKKKLDALKVTDGVASHPALDDAGKPRKGVLSLTNVNMGESTSSQMVIDLHDGTDKNPGPGKLVGALSATTCPIKIDIEFEAHNGGLGLAGQNAQEGENLVVFNKHYYQGCIHVMFHELSHSLGLAVNGAGGGDAHAKGMPDTKLSTEADPIYKENGSKGHIYERHGHSGWHCAFGMSDADKTTNAPDPDDHYSGGTCIMFGENTDTGPSLASSGFCPQCRVYIRARDLAKIG